MNMEEVQKLPIISIDTDPFFFVDNEVSEEKVKKLVGKKIAFKVSNDLSEVAFTGTLSEFEDNKLTITGEKNSINFDYSVIIGIEEIPVFDTVGVTTTLIDSICNITNHKNISIKGLLINVTREHVIFKIRTKEAIYITEIYPRELVKAINKLD